MINRQHLIAAVTTPDALTPELLVGVSSGTIDPNPALTQSPRPPGIEDTNFEVLVQPSKPTGEFKRTATTFLARGLPLRRLIAAAYDSPVNHVLLDSRLAETSYAVKVKVPESSAGQLGALVEQAISAACSVDVTRETIDMEVYILKAGTASTNLRRVEGPEKPIVADAGQIVSRGTYLKYFASVLEGEVGRPVVDETNINGLVDLSLYWDAKDPQSAIAALRNQLDLDLVPGNRARAGRVRQAWRRTLHHARAARWVAARLR